MGSWKNQIYWRPSNRFNEFKNSRSLFIVLF